MVQCPELSYAWIQIWETSALSYPPVPGGSCSGIMVEGRCLEQLELLTFFIRDCLPTLPFSSPYTGRRRQQSLSKWTASCTILRFFFHVALPLFSLPLCWPLCSPPSVRLLSTMAPWKAASLWKHHSEIKLNGEAVLLFLTPASHLPWCILQLRSQWPLHTVLWEPLWLCRAQSSCYSSQDPGICRYSLIKSCPECVNLAWLLCYSIDVDTHAAENIPCCLISYFAVLLHKT